MRFKNKIVLVTGASRNTGLGTAKGFLREGAFVFVNCLNRAEAKKAMAAFEKANLKNYTTVVADISANEEVEQMFSIIKKEAGKLDVLVNNACDQGAGIKFASLKPADFSRVLEVNVLGTFQVSLQAVHMMLRQKQKGVIINLGSNVSMRAIHDRTAYVSSKGAIESLTKSMATDLGLQGIRVNTVAPGYINTDRWKMLTSEAKKRRRKNIPVGYESTVDDIVKAILFLSSNEARSINGARLVVDGGCAAQHMPEDIDF